MDAIKLELCRLGLGLLSCNYTKIAFSQQSKHESAFGEAPFQICVLFWHLTWNQQGSWMQAGLVHSSGKGIPPSLGSVDLKASTHLSAEEGSAAGEGSVARAEEGLAAEVVESSEALQ